MVGSTARTGVTRAMATAPDALSLFAETSTALRRRVPFDAALWQATDPATGLATAPMRAENLGSDACTAYWDTELLTERVNRFRDLARAPVPVAALRATTGDAPERSATYRRFLRPRGVDDELRAVLRVDGQWWGQVSLYRERGRTAFDRRDLGLVAALTAFLARRLRSYARPAPALEDAGDGGPGLLLFTPTGDLLSVNEAARSFLAGLPAGPAAPARFGVAVPAWIHGAAALARTRDGIRVRARDRSGRWLICHASCLHDEAGSPTQTAVIIEPAKPSEIAAMVTAAYGLTERELEITQLIARGHSTAELAAALFISQHTVRDHVKAILAKTGTRTRGELVARLFTEHYRSRDPRTRIQVWDD